MISFLDGPAAGITLQLRSAPDLLRVVIHGVEFDALDQPKDVPRAEEQIVVYRRLGLATTYHLCARGKERHRSGWYSQAEYVLHDRQPDDAIARDTEAWQAWALSEQLPPQP